MMTRCPTVVRLKLYLNYWSSGDAATGERLLRKACLPAREGPSPGACRWLQAFARNLRRLSYEVLQSHRILEAHRYVTPVRITRLRCAAGFNETYGPCVHVTYMSHISTDHNSHADAERANHRYGTETHAAANH